MMKWRWREGVELGENLNVLRECWTFLTYIFLQQLRKQLSRILRFQIQEKFADIWLVLAIETVAPVGFCYLTFACENKQGNHCNWHKSFKELRLRKVQHYLSSLKEEKTLAFFDPTDIVAKKPQPLCKHKEGWKEGREKEEIRVHANGGGGEEKRGGGGGSFILSLYMSRVICKRYDNLRITWTLLNLWWKKEIDLLRSESGE